MKGSIQYLLGVLFVLATTNSFSQWSSVPSNNNPVIAYSADQEFHQTISDGSGGVYIVWADQRDDATNGWDIYAQHMDDTGSKLWNTDGLAIATSTGNQNYPFLVKDGSGGIMVFWSDYRSGDADIYGQRLASDGSILWTSGGKAIATGAGNQNFYYPYYKFEGFVMADASGGAFISYINDADGDKDVFVQKINSSGAVQWGASGVKATNLANDDQAQRLISDGSGGLIVSWENYNTGNGASKVYGQKVNSSGVVQWAANGVDLVPSPGSPGKAGDPEIIADGSGGAIVLFSTYPGVSTGSLYMQRVDASGSILWGNSGKSLSIQNQIEIGYIIETDGIGNYYIVWSDQRELQWVGPGIVDYGTNYDIYMQKIDVNGNKQWNSTGLLVNNADSVQYTPDMKIDTDGNIVLVWRDDRDFSGTSGRDIYAQKLDSDGNLIWNSDAVAVSLATGSQYEPQLVLSDAAGYIVVWRDKRNGDDDLYSSFINSDGTLAGIGMELYSDALVFIEASKTADDNDCQDLATIKNGAAEAYVYDATSIWREGFLGLADGTTLDNAGTNWSLGGSVVGPGFAEVRNYNGNVEFQGSDIQSEIVWQSEVVDISSYTSVGFSILLRSETSSGGFEADDYLNVFYSLDGAAAIPLPYGSFSGGVDENTYSAGTGIDQQVVNLTGISGTSLQIIVKMNNDEASEIYAIDDVHIQGKGAAAGGYTVKWFNGVVDATPDQTGNTYGSLDAGSYEVFADNGSGSITDTLNITIDRTQITPTLDLQVLSHQTLCSSPDGNLESTPFVLGGEPLTEFTFAWTIDGDAAVIGTNSTIDDLEANFYALKVTHPGSGCENTGTIEVEDNTVDPVVSATVDQNQSACNPASPNGSVSADVAGVTAGYTFYWFDGEVASPDIALADHTGSTYASLDAGKYTVVAVTDATGCESSAATVEVTQLVNIDLLAASISSHNNACDPALYNGEVSAEVDGQIEPSYTFAWYAGNSATGTVLGNSSTLSNLGGGSYTVLATQVSTSCTKEVTVVITDNLVDPVVSATVDQNQSACNPAAPNGSVSADVAGVTAGYTFYWFDGEVASPDIALADHTVSTYASLDAGKYTVVAVTDATGCESSAATVEVTQLVNIDLLAASISSHNNACDPALYNGEVSAEVDGQIEPSYTFAWYAGNSATGTVLGNSSTLSNLGGGSYTVLATQVSTSCTKEVTVVITDNLVDPVVSATVDQNQSACNPAAPNGSVSADVAGVTAGYTFYWFDGEVASPDIALADHTVSTYASLDAGKYTVVAVTDATGCESSAATVEVAQLVNIDLLAASISSHNNACDPALYNGEVSAEVDGQIEPSYTFAWYAGNSATGTVLGNSSTLSNLGGGSYTVLATQVSTSCTKEVTVVITDNLVDPVVSATVDQNQSACNPAAPNGSVSADVAGVTAGYTFYWFDGEVASPDIALADHTVSTYASLDAGKYTVVAVTDATGCESSAATVEVAQLVNIDLLAASISSHNNACDPALYNGEVSAEVDGQIEPSYTFAWYAGNSATGTVLGNSSTLSNLGGGSYTVLATQVSTSCTKEVTVVITDNLVDPVVSTSVAQDQSACNPANPNGSVLAEVGGLTSGYTFYWFDGEVASPDIALADYTGFIYTNLDAGKYTVVAVRNSTGCESSPALAEVKQLVNIDLLSVSATSANVACDPALYNGGATAAVDGQVEPAYTFSWHAGSSATGPAIGSTSTISSLAGGTYTVLATQAATGCTVEAQVEVVEDLTIPVVSTFSVRNQISCDPESPLGSIRANVSGSTSGFTFHWFDGLVSNPDLTTANSTGSNYSNIAAGSYTVVAVNDASGCVSSEANIEVVDDLEYPVITLIEPNEDDDIAGEFSANVEGMVEPFYFFEWFEGISRDLDESSVPIGTSSTITELEPGNYTLRVIDDHTGCSNLKDFVSIEPPFLAPVITSFEALSFYEIHLVWEDRNDDEDGFIIERKKDFDTGYTQIANLGTNTTTFSDTDIVPGLFYRYRVVSYRTEGDLTANSESVRLKTPVPPPVGQPTIVNTNVVDPAAVTLDWVYEGNPQGYVVERLDAETGTFDSIAATKNRSYIDLDVQDGEEYTYRVIAYNEVGFSDYSNEVDVMLLIEELVIVYPNPVHDELYVTYGGTSSYELRLYNEDGKLIRQSLDLYDDQILDVSMLNSEMLVLQVWSDGKMINKKVIKE